MSLQFRDNLRVFPLLRGKKGETSLQPFQFRSSALEEKGARKMSLSSYTALLAGHSKKGGRFTTIFANRNWNAHFFPIFRHSKEHTEHTVWKACSSFWFSPSGFPPRSGDMVPLVSPPLPRPPERICTNQSMVFASPRPSSSAVVLPAAERGERGKKPLRGLRWNALEEEQDREKSFDKKKRQDSPAVSYWGEKCFFMSCAMVVFCGNIPILNPPCK